MSVPGYRAEASLYYTSKCYRSVRSSAHDRGMPTISPQFFISGINKYVAKSFLTTDLVLYLPNLKEVAQWFPCSFDPTSGERSPGSPARPPLPKS